ncbi:unnamed protein product [Protopolystoma xenopodis]|uniref:Secreted protein n=1 Tax=Protopolystoma xenopodis TaxID=117903 RepID=A0A3S5CM08_9PLAT|nr:unnamed protein product [Protopolystoma xenopodis]
MTMFDAASTAWLFWLLSGCEAMRNVLTPPKNARPSPVVGGWPNPACCHAHSDVLQTKRMYASFHIPASTLELPSPTVSTRSRVNVARSDPVCLLAVENRERTKAEIQKYRKNEERKARKIDV